MVFVTGVNGLGFAAGLVGDSSLIASFISWLSC